MNSIFPGIDATASITSVRKARPEMSKGQCDRRREHRPFLASRKSSDLGELLVPAAQVMCSASGYSLKTDAVFLSMMAAAIQKSPGQAWGKNGFFLSPTSAWCPVSAVQPSVQSPQAFDTAETGQNRREYPRWFAPKPQPDRRIGVLFLCPHSFVMPRAPPIHHETIFREYRDALQD
jgi:hypothetical protein